MLQTCGMDCKFFFNDTGCTCYFALLFAHVLEIHVCRASTWQRHSGALFSLHFGQCHLMHSCSNVWSCSHGLRYAHIGPCRDAAHNTAAPAVDDDLEGLLIADLVKVDGVRLVAAIVFVISSSLRMSLFSKIGTNLQLEPTLQSHHELLV